MPEQSIDFAQVVEAALADSGTLTVKGVWSTPKETQGGSFRGAAVGSTAGFSYAAQVVEVSVDEDTGVVRVEQVWVAHDCGFAINPLAVEGQVQGAVWMGMGQALSEETQYHEGLSLRKSRGIYQVVISDGTGTVTLVWFQFNEKYLRTAYKKGASIILTSEITLGYRDTLQIVHPRPEDIEVIDEGEEIDEDNIHFNRIVPIYPLTEGLKQRRMRRIMKSVVDDYGSSVRSFIPLEILKKRDILDYGPAIKRVHFPEDQDKAIDLFEQKFIPEFSKSTI